MLVGEGRVSFRDVRAGDATVECLSRNTVASVTRIFCLTLLLVATEAVPAPMTFKNISTGGNHCCWWTAAEGEITDDTPREFERLFKTLSSPIRFNSPGGSLFAALELGSLMRKNGFDTEVGRTNGEDKLDGACASACAYAFMGGVGRYLDAKLGVHRFYSQAAIANYSAKQFSGGDLDGIQRTFAALVLYFLQMGIEAKVVELADQAGPDEMHWISPTEAAELKITYDPQAWTPWKLEPYKAGVVAFSKSGNGNTQMTILCSRHLGGQLLLTVKDWDLAYANQMQTCSRSGFHPIFGARVSNQDVTVSAVPGGGSALKFKLPPNVPFSDPSLFNDLDSYPMACFVGFRGSKDGFPQSGRLALRNCID